MANVFLGTVRIWYINICTISKGFEITRMCVNIYALYVVKIHSGLFWQFQIRNCWEIVWYIFKFTIESWLKDRKLVSNLVAETTHCPETITNTFVAFSNRPSISFFIRIDLTFDYPLMILAEMEALVTVICKDFVWT